MSVMQLLNSNLEIFKQQLAETHALAPAFFKNAPVILDLQKLSTDDEINFTEIIDAMRSYGMLPVGILGGTDAQRNSAITNNLGLINNTRSTSKQKEDKPERNPTTVVTKHIRSGQQIHAKGGDLVVTASVSPGAEILADGNIHVYGALNGRALAGINGDKTARIFCTALNAELISIAGFYQLSEDLPTKYSSPVQIFLENNKLQIKPL